jgi:rusticyanin
MKRISIALATVISLSLGAVLVGCQSSSNSGSGTGNQTTQTAQDTAAFQLVKKTDQKLSADDLKKAQTTITQGKVSADKSTLTFDQKDISLVVRTGPEDDMVSFRIQGIRNPTLVIPSGATLKVLFVNTDDGMTHDFLIGAAKAPFGQHPDTANTVGSDRMQHAENEMFSAQELIISADQDGVFSYFCSVAGHAKKGMWGTLSVGKDAASQKLPSGHDAGKTQNSGMNSTM